jgi:hypothetical protein
MRRLWLCTNHPLARTRSGARPHFRMLDAKRPNDDELGASIGEMYRAIYFGSMIGDTAHTQTGL